MHIRGTKVTLRAPEPADAPLLNQWANDPDLWPNLKGWHFPYSLASTQRWIESGHDSDPKARVFCIHADGKGLVGTATLNAIDWKNRTASYGGLIIGSEQHRGEGYAVDAMFALLRYCFDELGLERLDAEVLARNQRSLAFVRKCGWTVEGTRRAWVYKDGQRHDLMMIGISRPEYEAAAAAAAHWRT